MGVLSIGLIVNDETFTEVLWAEDNHRFYRLSGCFVEVNISRGK